MSRMIDLPEWVRDNQAYRIDFGRAPEDSTMGVQKNTPIKANVGGTANVISSEVPSTSPFPISTSMHSVMLDLDIPHRLISSSTPGHSHLYLDVTLSGRKYRELLVALWNAGIIQGGILDQFDQHGATFLRLPDVKKKLTDTSY